MLTAAGVTTLEVSPSQFQLSPLSHPHPLHLPAPSPAHVDPQPHHSSARDSSGAAAGVGLLQHHEDAETALRGKLGSTAGWDMAAVASPHPQTCQHNQTNTATPALPPSPPPTLPKLFKSSIRKCKKCTRTQNPGPTAPTGAAAGEAHLKRERDSPAAPAAACLPRRQHWHNFPTDLWRQRLMARDRGLSPRARLGVGAAGENRGNC